MAAPPPTFSRSTGAFDDHFGKLVSNYSQFRPTYPRSVYDTLLSYAEPHTRDLAVDIGCGTGQATLPLKNYYKRVVGIEPSEGQINTAREEAKQKGVDVEFVQSPAEVLPFEEGSVDLVTCAQAAHWFDLPVFFAEVHRVLKPGGSLAIWTYGTCDLLNNSGANAVFKDFYYNTLGDKYWPPNRWLVENLYKDITIPSPPFVHTKRIDENLAIDKEMNLDSFEGYVKSWSGYKEYVKINKEDPSIPLKAALQREMALQGTKALRVNWKVVMLLAKKVLK